MTSLDKATRELQEMSEMIAERVPAMRDRIDALLAKAAEDVVAMFAPYVDYADGRITLEEFQARMQALAEAEQERRRRHYGNEPVLELTCETCGRQHEWDVEEHEGDYPAVYFECEDVGETCDPVFLALQHEDGEHDDEAVAGCEACEALEAVTAG